MVIKYDGSILYFNILVVTCLHVFFTYFAKVVLLLDKRMARGKNLEKNSLLFQMTQSVNFIVTRSAIDLEFFCFGAESGFREM